jgi:AraC-like DNA-binding protein
MLILNQDQPYTIEVDSHDPVETFCVFFERDFVPARSFANQVGPDSMAVLRELYQAVVGGIGGPGWREDQLHRLAETMHLDRIPARKRSTREALYRRMRRVREMIDESPQTRLSLSVLARAAAMAPFHFHRLFRSVYGLTPHQYVAARRLDRAAGLLAMTSTPVTEIALDSGFESVSAFSSEFHRRMGASPRQYREIRKIRQVFPVPNVPPSEP